MGECLITRRGAAFKLPVLSEKYPEDISTAVIKGNTTSATFKVEIAIPGSPAAYTYQWYVDGSPVEGATNSTYTRSGLSATATYTVYCEVTNKKGTVTSRVATLQVTQIYTPVLNSSYPADVTVTKNNSVTSKVVIDTKGNPDSYTYQWYKNGSAVSGATSSSYTFAPTTIGTTKIYCAVTNSAGTVNSRTATITAEGLFLFRNGDNTSLTGGWSNISGSYAQTLIVDSTQVALCSGEASSVRYAGTVNAVDLSNYNTIYFDGINEGGSDSDNYSFVLMTERTKNGTKVGQVRQPYQSRKVVSIDLSKITNRKAIYIALTNASGSGYSRLYRCWVE